MKKIIILLFFTFISSISFSQCVNADFSLGNFSNWTGSVGTYSATNGVYSSTGAMVIGTVNQNTYATDMGRQTIITQPLADPETQNVLIETPPSGGYSCRLGNPRTGSCDGGDAQEEQLKYSLYVTSSNCVFTYQYAVVLHDPGASASHTAYTRPKFTIEILNASGAIIDSACGLYSVVGQAGNPGFISCAADANDACDKTDDVVWKNWTTVAIDLSPYIGSTVSVLFDTRDCNPSGNAGKHFGYAYISCSCGAFQLVQQCVGTSDLITAPNGYANYEWKYINSSGTNIDLNTTWDTLTVNPVPNGHTITCICTSVTGCTFTYTLNLSIDIPVFTPAAPTICSGQTAVITAHGDGPYSYIWNTGIADSTISVSPTSTTPYTVTATAPGGCRSSSTVIVNVHPLPTGTTQMTPTNCGQNNGTITITPTIGTQPFSYTWNTSPIQYTQTATNQLAGTYTVSITDSNGCSSTVSGTISGITGPTITGVVKNETCAGYSNGSITTSVTNAIQPISYIWSTNDTAPNLINISGGIYSVTITDSAGCKNTNTFTVLSDPIITLITSGTNTHCGNSDGTVNVNPSGGNGNYFYSWDTPNSALTQSVSNLPAGTYNVTVTDGGCSATSIVTISNISGPSVTIKNVINEVCNNGKGGATAVATGGTPGYHYDWDSSPEQYDSTLQNVHQGTYTVIVTDANGCTATNKVTITNSSPQTVSIDSIKPANCGFHNGSIYISVTGGTLPYKYYWSNSQTTQNATGLITGSYTVTVADSNNCTATINATVPQLPGPTASAIGLPDICSQSKGSVIAAANGGHGAPYTYKWNTTPPQYSDTAINLKEGSYVVTISDGGCSATATINISNIPGPNASFFANPKYLTVLDGPVSFIDESTGSVISWNWTMGDYTTETGKSFTHAYPDTGTYKVTEIVTDTNGCKDTARGEIVVRDIYTFYIPNCFTPSGDSLNDWFYPQGINWDPNYFEMYIFDRWGNIMFKSLDINNNKWNGTFNNSGTKEDALMDVYVYLIRTKELHGPKHQYIGKVTLMR